jgi:hypothetical protein
MPTQSFYPDLSTIVKADRLGEKVLFQILYYRVAYLRKSLNSGIPTGHIHVGFNSTDPNSLRDKMLEDVIHIIKKFIEP